jgi:hypothetical protein
MRSSDEAAAHSLEQCKEKQDDRERPSERTTKAAMTKTARSGSATAPDLHRNGAPLANDNGNRKIERRLDRKRGGEAGLISSTVAVKVAVWRYCSGPILLMRCFSYLRVRVYRYRYYCSSQSELTFPRAGSSEWKVHHFQLIDATNSEPDLPAAPYYSCAEVKLLLAGKNDGQVVGF